MEQVRERYRQYRWRIWLGLGLLLLLLGGGAISLVRRQRQNQAADQSLLEATAAGTSGAVATSTTDASVAAESSGATTKPSGADKQAAVIYAEIKGAVQRPDVYRFKSDQRVIDLLERAGGLTKDGDDRTINLASPLTDGLSIYVPTKAEVAQSGGPELSGQSAGSTTSTSPAEGAGDQVDLNHADAATLQTISGIGPKKAEDIIAYREQAGGFKSVDELTQVSGIGDKTLAKIRDRLCVR
ncbi:helix-hairpin-helix domain-containing protein [Lapidilactobacillus achengensis]|uniref:Helix-hairpin-helix domain-containing protein n=1 Tax=Lapidilactobacillus achengensis TaxID=2486000 RepID=A0ABW1URN4_9LACO|nr:ComEA family DNA-binding protein [Lapidilactobacillus achengensis]